MANRSPLLATLIILFLISPPMTAPTAYAGAAPDFDPLLGPWPLDRLVLPVLEPDPVPQLPGPTLAGLMRQGIDRLDEAWRTLRGTLGRAAPALRAGARLLDELMAPVPPWAPECPEPEDAMESCPDAEAVPAPALGSDAAFMLQYFDELFRPQAASAGPRRREIDLAEIFVKLTAVAFVGAIVLVPAGCAGATSSLYGRALSAPHHPAAGAAATPAGPRPACR